MGETMTDSQSAGGGNFDLTQFYQIFFEEAGENLEQMEQMLLALDLEQADDEELNAIFRCAHSIKGGAATFGFADVAELTHQMESLLDKLRRHELQPTRGDGRCAARILRRTQAAARPPPGPGRSSRRPPPTWWPASAPSRTATPPPPCPPRPPRSLPRQPAVVAGTGRCARTRRWPSGEREADQIRVGPMDQPDAGRLHRSSCSATSPVWAVSRRLPCDQEDQFGCSREVFTSSSDTDLMDLFTFHVSKEQIQITDAAAPAAEPAPAPAKLVGEGTDFGFFDDAPGVPTACRPGTGHARPIGRTIAHGGCTAAKPAPRKVEVRPRRPPAGPGVQHAARVGQQGRPADQPRR